MQAVGYVRVSTDEQTATPSRQRSAIEELAGRRGWRLLGVYEDIGVSGATEPLQRPGFRAAVEELERVGGGFLLAWSLDRISRGTLAEQMRLLAELAKRNIFVYTVLEAPFFDQLYRGSDPLALAQARLYLEIRAAFSNFEREMIRRRVKEAMRNPEVRRRMIEGMRRAGLLVAETLPTETVRRILDLRRQGYPIRKIAEKLRLTYHAVYKVIKKVEKGGLSDTTCPRCYHRMTLEPFPPRLVCKKCGYEKPLYPVKTSG